MEMIQIPEYFKTKARRQFGQEGPKWVNDLPSTLSECVDRWGLSDLVVVGDLSINFLCYATSKHGDVVLKISGPHSERYTEMVALTLYDGKHACRCFESDHELGAMLLERIKPGHCLRFAVPEDEQLSTGAQLVRDLPIPIGTDLPLPSYSDWIERAIRTVHAKYRPSQDFRKTMDAALQLFTEIPNANRCLLHGDLHHDNVLLASDGSWKVIDPQGVIGAPVLECGRFIQNHVIRNDNVLDLHKAEATIDYMASVLEQQPRLVSISFFVLHVLSFCWGFEMNYTAERLKTGAEQCAALLGIIPD
jgi:streptomycin 6-kinase